MTADVSACILAGGRATRLGGRAKPLVPVDGATILERQLDVLVPLVAEVLVAIAPGAAPLPVPARYADHVRFVEDAVAGAGPLAGITAGLSGCRTPWLLVVAGDLPHLQPDLVRLVCARVQGAQVDAVVPRVQGLPEPLLAVYAASVEPVARARLLAGRRKAAGLVTEAGLRVAWIEEAELRSIDHDLRSFADVDTPEDLARSQRDRSGD